jgi:hypothetical protein
MAEVSGELHFGPTKTHQDRTILLPPFLRDRLAEHLAAPRGTQYGGAGVHIS